MGCFVRELEEGMMDDLKKLRELAQAATKDPVVALFRLERTCTPAVILSLVERLSTAEDLLRQAAERLQWAAASDAAGDYTLAYEIGDHLANADKQEEHQ
jgi:hypothetical protein